MTRGMASDPMPRNADLIEAMHRVVVNELPGVPDWQVGLARRLAKAALDALPQSEPRPDLAAAAQRLCDAIADESAIKGLGRGWEETMDAEAATLCALQDTRTALDGRERPHRHVRLREQSA